MFEDMDRETLLNQDVSYMYSNGEEEENQNAIIFYDYLKEILDQVLYIVKMINLKKRPEYCIKVHQLLDIHSLHSSSVKTTVQVDAGV